jgi:hypothetical protein
MSFGVALSNAIAIGLGGIATLLSGDIGAIYPPTTGNLLTEANDNLVQEDDGLILLE